MNPRLDGVILEFFAKIAPNKETGTKQNGGKKKIQNPKGIAALTDLGEIFTSFLGESYLKKTCFVVEISMASLEPLKWNAPCIFAELPGFRFARLKTKMKSSLVSEHRMYPKKWEWIFHE